MRPFSAVLLVLGAILSSIPATAHATTELCDIGQETISSFETHSLVVAICQADNMIQYRQITKQDQTRLNVTAREFPIYGKWASGRAFEADDNGITYRLYTGNRHVQISGPGNTVLLSEDAQMP